MGRLYDKALWKRVRKLHLASEPFCRHHKAREQYVPATDVDHILAVSKGGEMWADTNLQSLCHTCHSMKTARDDGKTVRMGCDIDGNPLDSTHHWSAKDSTERGERGMGSSS